MVASDTRHLTGRPKLLYLQRPASPWIIHQVPSTGLEAKEWGRGSGLLGAGQARKHSWKKKNQDRYICSEWSVKYRENAKPGIEKEDDSWRQARRSSCIFLSIPNTIQILLDSLMSVGKQTLLEHAYYQYYKDTFAASQNGCIHRGVGRQHWGLLMWFLLRSRTLVYFVMLICLASIDPWPSSDALWCRLMCLCVCARVCKGTDDKKFWSDFQIIIIKLKKR